VEFLIASVWTESHPGRVLVCACEDGGGEDRRLRTLSLLDDLTEEWERQMGEGNDVYTLQFSVVRYPFMLSPSLRKSEIRQLLNRMCRPHWMPRKGDGMLATIDGVTATLDDQNGKRRI